jgi:uncharacterized protein with GYD domain
MVVARITTVQRMTASGDAGTVEDHKRGEDMATYIMFSNLTDEGRKTLKERPERLGEVNKEVESMGARVTSQYAVLGGYDFVNIIEAPTNEVMARIAMELGARGTIKVTTMPAMPVAQFVDMLLGKSPGGA